MVGHQTYMKSLYKVLKAALFGQPLGTSLASDRVFLQNKRHRTWPMNHTIPNEPEGTNGLDFWCLLQPRVCSYMACGRLNNGPTIFSPFFII